MSLVTREMAAQGQKNGDSDHVNGNSNHNDDGVLVERGTNDRPPVQRETSFNDNSSAVSRTYKAPHSSFSIPKQNGGGDRSANALADFFSQEVFQIVLHNPTTAHRLLKFSQARMCGENMEFLEKVSDAPSLIAPIDSNANRAIFLQVDRYNALLDELTTIMTDIHYSYTSNEAPKQLGIHSNMLRRINADIKASTTSTLPAMESVFADARDNVEGILRTAVYPRFVKYQMTNSASKALSTDRGRYQGLGDCFCLTDPAYDIKFVTLSENVTLLAHSIIEKPIIQSCTHPMALSASLATREMK